MKEEDMIREEDANEREVTDKLAKNKVSFFLPFLREALLLEEEKRKKKTK